MNSADPSPPTIVVVAFDQISPFHLAVPCVVFGEAHPGCPSIPFKVCSAESGKLQTSAGFDIAISAGLAVLRRADIVIVPSWRNPDEKPPAALIKGLIAAHTRGATIVGLCLGAFVLAEAGLLDGRRATTHWAYAEEFSTRYPQVSVDSDVLYVEDNRILTSAGTAAGLDCCLFLMRKHFGSAVANRVARRLVVPPHRQGGQAQFIERPIPETPSNSRLSQSLAWLKKNLHLTHTVDSIALTASMSRRTFTRQFKQLTGMGFASWLAMERLSHVQRLLESTVLSIDTVAERSGFGSAESLRLHFRRQYGVSPREWRRTFRSD